MSSAEPEGERDDVDGQVSETQDLSKVDPDAPISDSQAAIGNPELDSSELDSDGADSDGADQGESDPR